MAINTAANNPLASVGGAYQSALNRWLTRQKQSAQQFQGAADPLQQAVSSFQPGGSFGAGRIADLEAGARKSKALAMSNQVASGMSSGSLATSTGLRVDADLAQAKLGVEDTRTQFLNQARQALSGLRGQQASQTGATSDPFFNTAISSQVAAQGQELGFISGRSSPIAQRRQLDAAKKEADRAYDLQVKQLEAKTAKPATSGDRIGAKY